MPLPPPPSPRPPPLSPTPAVIAPTIERPPARELKRAGWRSEWRSIDDVFLAFEADGVGFIEAGGSGGFVGGFGPEGDGEVVVDSGEEVLGSGEEEF